MSTRLKAAANGVRCESACSAQCLIPPQIDQRIREIYLNQPDAKSRRGIRLLAKQVGMPHWSLKKCARELGLARTKRRLSEPLF